MHQVWLDYYPMHLWCLSLFTLINLRDAVGHVFLNRILEAQRPQPWTRSIIWTSCQAESDAFRTEHALSHVHLMRRFPITQESAARLRTPAPQITVWVAMRALCVQSHHGGLAVLILKQLKLSYNLFRLYERLLLLLICGEFLISYLSDECAINIVYELIRPTLFKTILAECVDGRLV